ncbi:hypothetical protein ACQW02_18840 [Humitalea sp. 24SJ18S-53]|uniref:hypothetical protein n=1 Tax=Humitalea sp. 24SJ18S-53 TaxID=3422307 RepID=UPI003D66468E
MTEAERDLLGATAHLLAQGRRLDALSRGFTVVAVAGLVLVPALGGAVTLLLAGMMLAGLCQTYVAIRVGFDAALFAALAQGAAPRDLAGLDTALTSLGLMPAVKAGRPLALRIGGARQLLARQAMLVALQAVLALLGALTSG